MHYRSPAHWTPYPCYACRKASLVQRREVSDKADCSKGWMQANRRACWYTMLMADSIHFTWPLSLLCSRSTFLTLSLFAGRSTESSHPIQATEIRLASRHHTQDPSATNLKSIHLPRPRPLPSNARNNGSRTEQRHPPRGTKLQRTISALFGLGYAGTARWISV